jgi:hypothetical protein
MKYALIYDSDGKTDLVDLFDRKEDACQRLLKDAAYLATGLTGANMYEVDGELPSGVPLPTKDMRWVPLPECDPSAQECVRNCVNSGDSPEAPQSSRWIDT